MRDTLHVVIDIETLGNRPGCQIRTLGAQAVCFDSQEGFHVCGLPSLGDPFFYQGGFYRRVRSKGNMELDALQWWTKQGCKVWREALVYIEHMPIAEAMAELSASVVLLQNDCGLKKVAWWGNGNEFDQACIEAALARTGHKPPWEYWESHNLRTLCKFVPVRRKHRRILRHHAGYDANHEALRLADALNWINDQNRQGNPITGSNAEKAAEMPAEYV